jgi:prevent-host-death family protein
MICNGIFKVKLTEDSNMQSCLESAKTKFIIDEKGRKKAVVLDLKEYKNLMETIEDLEDTNDLLRAEREATDFIPYERFRKNWLKS